MCRDLMNKMQQDGSETENHARKGKFFIVKGGCLQMRVISLHFHFMCISLVYVGRVN